MKTTKAILKHISPRLITICVLLLALSLTGFARDPGFPVHYVRCFNPPYGQNIIVINSMEEFRLYHSRWHRGGCGVYPAQYCTLAIRFLDYSEDFFETHFLVAIPRSEPSISTLHRVLGIDRDGTIRIRRYNPYGFLMGVGNWRIILELDQRMHREHFDVEFIDHHGHFRPSRNCHFHP